MSLQKGTESNELSEGNDFDFVEVFNKGFKGNKGGENITLSF